MAFTETVFGLGVTMGPAIGSGLYSLGGFGLPFWTVGSIGLVLAGLIYIFLPRVKSKKTESTDDGKPLTLKTILTVWSKEIIRQKRTKLFCLPSVANDVHSVFWQLHRFMWQRNGGGHAGTVHEKICWGNSGSSWNNVFHTWRFLHGIVPSCWLGMFFSVSWLTVKFICLTPGLWQNQIPYDCISFRKHADDNCIFTNWTCPIY